MQEIKMDQLSLALLKAIMMDEQTLAYISRVVTGLDRPNAELRIETVISNDIDLDKIAKLVLNELVASGHAELDTTEELDDARGEME